MKPLNVCKSDGLPSSMVLACLTSPIISPEHLFLILTTPNQVALFFVPRVRCIASKSFYYDAILDWNALRLHIQTIGSKLEFKKGQSRPCPERESRNTWLRLHWDWNLRNFTCAGLLSSLSFFFSFCPWLLLGHSHLFVVLGPHWK